VDGAAGQSRGVTTAKGTGRPVATVRGRAPARPGRREGALEAFAAEDCSENPRASSRVGEELARGRAESPIFAIGWRPASGMQPADLATVRRLGLGQPDPHPGSVPALLDAGHRAMREIARERGGPQPRGIRRILELEDQVTSLTRRVRELEARSRTNCSPARATGVRRRAEGDVISLRAGTRVKKSNQLVVWRPFRSDGDSR